MRSRAGTKLLPRLNLTEVVSPGTSGARKVVLTDHSSDSSYLVRPCTDETSGARSDARPRWMGTSFNLFPLVVDSHGVPWAEATLYIVHKLENNVSPNMSTAKSIADDLSAFLRFIEESSLDWATFPQRKLERPTYRFRAELMLLVRAGELAASTARRRMGSVVAFYRWLLEEKLLVAEHQPWSESKRFISFSDARGMQGVKTVTTTDLRISAPSQTDPYTTFIDDGGKLRPLPQHEQEWVLDALVELGNIELTLIHLVALLTGARMQSVLTFRVGHVSSASVLTHGDDVRLPIGPGTGIDTKNDKKMVLHAPAWLYQRLQDYAVSPRAIRRRERALGGDSDSQYLFLSARGAPFYQSKADALTYDPKNDLRHAKAGQAIRQLVAEYIVPGIRAKHSPKFSYRFHDLRATYGMNLTDEQLRLVAAGEITLHEAREHVKDLMGHESAATTDRYLQYRGRLQFVRKVNDSYGEHLQRLVERACASVL